LTNGKINRDKLLSLRVSDNEYEVLRRLFRKNGFRSASEFVRAALRKMVETDPVASPPRSRLDELEFHVESLSAHIHRLTRLVEAFHQQNPENDPAFGAPITESSALRFGEAQAGVARSRARLTLAMREFDAAVREISINAQDAAALKRFEAVSAEKELAWSELNSAIRAWKALAAKPPEAPLKSKGAATSSRE